MITLGCNLVRTDVDNVFESHPDMYMRKEGILFLINYTKGAETQVTLNLWCYIDNVWRKLTETQVYQIIEWQRYLMEGVIVYPTRLPGVANKIRIEVVSDVDVTDPTFGSLDINIKYNSFFN